MRSQKILSYAAAGLLAASALTGLTAAIGTRAHAWDAAFGMSLMTPCVALAILALALALVWVGRALAANDATGFRPGMAALAGAMVLLYFPLSAYARGTGAPPIHDISTDTENPPPFVAVLAERAGASNPPDYDGDKTITWEGRQTTVSLAQRKHYGDLHGLALLTKPIVIFWRAVNTANEMGWKVVSFDPANGRIEATDTSLFFGLKYDVSIRVRPAGRLGARLDVRSKSREGVNDRGVNAAIIKAYLRKMRGR